MHQQEIENGDGSHSFHHRHCSWHHARVMSSMRTKRHCIPILVYGFLLLQNGSHGFESHSESDIGTIAYAPLYAAAVVAHCRRRSVGIGIEPVCHLRTSHGSHSKPITIFKPFCCIDAEHGSTEGGMQFVKLRFPQSCGASTYYSAHHAANGIALTLHFHY